MIMTYTNLSTDDLGGQSIADYVISIDADFQVLDESTIVYQEPSFPVVELARSLHGWLRHCDIEPGFSFDSLSFDQLGVLTIAREESGWIFSSSFTPQVRSSAVGWSEVESCVTAFIDRVRTDLTLLGIDARRVLVG